MLFVAVGTPAPADYVRRRVCMARNMTVAVEGVEYTMALLGRDADAVVVPGGVLVFLDTTAMRDGGGKVKADGKVGQLTTVADSGGFRPLAGFEPKVSVGCWTPRAVVAPSVKVKAPAGKIAGRK